MPYRAIRDSRGVALPMAIFALVVIGVLVGASFYIGRQEQAVGRNTVGMQQAFAAAEEGAELQVATWDASLYNKAAVGSEQVIPDTKTATGWYRGGIRRLNDLLFFIRSEGFSRDSLSRQQVGILVRLRPIELEVTAALKTQGEITIGGNSFTDGKDNVPPAWSGCSTKDPLPGIQVPDLGLIKTNGCKDFNCVSGDPKVEADATITTETLTSLGDATFDEWRQYATKYVTASGGTGNLPTSAPSVAADGSCNKAASTNWGAPEDASHPCANYFPIIWVEAGGGSVSIQGDRGQGVLLVNGNLKITGGFRFYGPVIVKGTFETAGTGGGGAKFYGGVIAANVSLDDQTVTGNATVMYSSCAVERALQNSAPASLLRSRSWANLY